MKLYSPWREGDSPRSREKSSCHLGSEGNRPGANMNNLGAEENHSGADMNNLSAEMNHLVQT